MVVADHDAGFRAACRRLIDPQTDMEIAAEVLCGDDVFPATVQHVPDLLILSLSIDGNGGFAALEQIHAASLSTRVIAICRNSSQDDCVRAVRLGCRGALPQDPESELFLKCIRKVYEGEMWLDRATTAEVLRQLTTEPVAVEKLRDRDNKLSPLSPREREIVGLVTQGYRNKELAEKLTISEQTVKNHMHNIFDKLGVSDRLELTLYAIHNNLL